MDGGNALHVLGVIRITGMRKKYQAKFTVTHYHNPSRSSMMEVRLFLLAGAACGEWG